MASGFRNLPRVHQRSIWIRPATDRKRKFIIVVLSKRQLPGHLEVKGLAGDCARFIDLSGSALCVTDYQVSVAAFQPFKPYNLIAF
jgi:hypothetical protein